MKQYLLTTLANSKNYTMAVAEAMPENDYEYKPVPDIWSFREQLDHISYGIGWWKENYINDNKQEWAPIPGGMTKKEIMQSLNHSFDELRRTIEIASNGEDLIKGFASTLNHITHHRGQAIIYLRSKGIAVPEYVY